MSALTPPKSVQEKPFTHSYALIRDIYNRSDYFHQRPPPGSQLMMGGGRQLEKNQGVLMQDGNISRDVAKYLRGALSGYFADETGYPDDEDEPAVQATPRESEPKLRESFLDRFSKLQISAGHDAWDAAEGAGMFMSSSFHQPSPRVPQIPTLVSSPTKECHAEFEWSGTMGFSRDDHPYVGRVPEIGKEAAEKLGIPEMNDTRGLWVCAGFCGHGMALVSGSTKALGGMVARDEAEGADGDDEAWKRVEDWFPEAFIVTSERLGIEAEKDGIEGQYQGWVIVNGYKEEADDM